MNPDDIKPGRTYEGESGERTRVVERRVTTITNEYTERAYDEVRVHSIHHPLARYIVPTDSFAVWAQREVPNES